MSLMADCLLTIIPYAYLTLFAALNPLSNKARLK